MHCGNYPFLSHEDTIKFIRASKLMLVTNRNGMILSEVSRIYGESASCICSTDEREQFKEAQDACESHQHLVAISSSYDNSTLLQRYAGLAKENNYLFSLSDEAMDLFPYYIGWHLNEADSHMLHLVAQAHLEEQLKTVSEFCSDFRNFSQCETIREMLKYYKLATSNYNGMLHCTAKFIGSSATQSSKDYIRCVQSKVSQFFETSIIGFFLTPRTFGARVKLSTDQLQLWGGDDDVSISSAKSNLPIKSSNPSQSNGKDDFILPSGCQSDPVLSLCSDLAFQSISMGSKTASAEVDQLTNIPVKNSRPLENSQRRFPHCQASLICIPANDTPDFRPVSGRGRRAHMTIGVAPGVSAVTTGTDLLEIVDCESEHGVEWSTYEGPRGWLRDYGKGRWVLYLKKHIQVGTLFTGIYNFLSDTGDKI